MAGVLLHVLGDAANNVGVIIAAVVIWKTDSEARYYADPAVSVAIALMIFFSSLPLGNTASVSEVNSADSGLPVKKTGVILMESVPRGVNPYDVLHDLQKVVPSIFQPTRSHLLTLACSSLESSPSTNCIFGGLTSTSPLHRRIS
jgi:zinc transporter 1